MEGSGRTRVIGVLVRVQIYCQSAITLPYGLMGGVIRDLENSVIVIRDLDRSHHFPTPNVEASLS